MYGEAMLYCLVNSVLKTTAKLNWRPHPIQTEALQKVAITLCIPTKIRYTDVSWILCYVIFLEVPFKILDKQKLA